MITLITGKTGNGKSLYAITEIEKRRIAEGREIYYHGIPELKLDWIYFDEPRKWSELPQGAIIVIDEARAAFPVRPNSSTVPDYVAAFELHRKQGHDIYLLSQQPSFLDNHIRKLTDVHFHLMREFGDEVSIVHKWFTCKDNCHLVRDGSITSKFEYPKQNYGLYKSAELHTIKPQKPFRYYLKYIIPLIVVALCVVAYYAFSSAIHKGEETTNTLKSEFEALPSVSQKPEYKNKEDDPNYYFTQLTPRLPLVALSAPKYDEVTKPVIAPIPAACIASSTKCVCYTQQGTKMMTDEFFCRNVVANGYFVDFDDGSGNKQQAPNNKPVVNAQTQVIPAVVL